MGLPNQPVTLTVEQLAELNKKLSTMRHDINNNLSLIIAAVDHKDVFLESAYQYAKLLPNNKVVEIRGTSHFPHLERTDEFNRLNIEFLQGR